MARTYLFYDIESANNINGQGYICSFGYVLCDENFRVLESDDLVMNPNVEFDPMLLQPDSKCFLAYTKEYFIQQPDFTFFYDKIKNLLCADSRKSVGFAVEQDVDFILCAFSHFDMEGFHFASFDIRSVAEKLEGVHNTLGGWNDYYKIDTSSLRAHNSRDDAMMTMFLARALCRKLDVSLDELMEQYPAFLRDSQESLRNKRYRFYKRYMTDQIKSLHGVRNSSPLTHKLKGSYKMVFDATRDFEQKYEFCRLVYDNGGRLVNKADIGCTVVLEDWYEKKDWMNKLRVPASSLIYTRELFEKLGMEEPEYKEQTKDVPDLQAEFDRYTYS